MDDINEIEILKEERVIIDSAKQITDSQPTGA